MKKASFFKTPLLSGRTIVFHGVSVGEVVAMTNLIKKTKEEMPDCKIIITTGTPTGQATAIQKLGDVANFITYFPFDFPIFVNSFLNKIQPDAILMMETELWPNFAHIVNKKNIPLIIINGRISDRTYRSYKKLSFFFAPILKNYTNIFSQSEQDMKKLISIGANPETSHVMGNLKFDIKKQNSNIDLGNGRIIIAGSTHKGEDEIALKTFCNLKKDFSDIKLLIAPRHPERNNDVYSLCEKTGLECGKRSLNDNFNVKDIILLDTMGELGKIYSICEFAFIGGSFNKTGGHNPLEATIFNKPTISGPSIHNFKDIYAILTSTKASRIVNNQEELQEQMKKLLSDNKYLQEAKSDCEKVFNDNSGALDFVVNHLKSLW